MRCPSHGRLAAASAGEDAAAELHAESCARCRAELSEMAAVVRRAREAPPPVLTDSRRTAIRTEVLAACDTAGPVARRPRGALVAAAAAAAIAAVVTAVAWHGRSTPPGPRAAASTKQAGGGAPAAPLPGTSAAAPTEQAAAVAAVPPLPRTSATTSTEQAGAGAPAAPLAGTNAAAPTEQAAAVAAMPPLAGTAVPERRRTVPRVDSGAVALGDPHFDPNRDPHPLPAARSGAAPAAPSPTSASPPARSAAHDSPSRPGATAGSGRATIDTRNTAPVRVVSGDTAITVAASKVELLSRGGAVVKVHVVVGSAEVELRGKRTVVFAGDVWVRPAPPPRTPAATALSAFERGWIAFREGRYSAAIAAFDEAQDPVIAEDAAYWAAIASARAGELEAAARRLRGFIARFPTTTRADDARQALARLEPH